jgi:16S rRNA (cytosine1402-N4)-methyltransferase
MHTSVLLNESVEGLGLKKGDVVVDGTAGAGGHSAEICKREKSVKIIAFDLDGQALKHAEKMIAKAGCKPLMINANFKNMASELEKEGITEVDKIILDFGISSDQLDESGRGFTFLKDEPLLMTMKKDLKEEDLTAKEIVNNWSEENLATIIYGYGEEKYSRKIAKAIVEARKQKERGIAVDRASFDEEKRKSTEVKPALRALENTTQNKKSGKQSHSHHKQPNYDFCVA